MYSKYLFRLIPVIALIFLTTACGDSDSTVPTPTPGENITPQDPEKKLMTISSKNPDTGALTLAMTYTYDEESGLLQSYSLWGAKTRLDYDELGRVIREDRFLNDDPAPYQSYTWEYDEDGRVIRTDYNDDPIVLEYDDSGRITKITHVDALGAAKKIETWTYDGAGKPTGIRIAPADAPDTPIKTYTYFYTAAGEFHQAVCDRETKTYEWESDTTLKVTYEVGENEFIEVLTFSDSPVAWEAQSNGGNWIFLPRYYTDLVYLTGSARRMDPFGIRGGLYTRVEYEVDYLEFDFDAEGYPVELRDRGDAVVYEWE